VNRGDPSTLLLDGLGGRLRTGPSTSPSTSSGRSSGRGLGRSKEGWTLVCGSGFEEGDGDREHRLDDLPGDILVVGPCACQEVGDRLAGRFHPETQWDFCALYETELDR
jgi:hypothetical protein